MNPKTQKILRIHRLLLAEYGDHPWHPGDDRAWARRDPDLAFIRDDPRFEELVGEE